MSNSPKKTSILSKIIRKFFFEAHEIPPWIIISCDPKTMNMTKVVCTSVFLRFFKEIFQMKAVKNYFLVLWKNLPNN